MAARRTIKKYPNRRLYDTERSRYITLADLRELVLEGVEFEVKDANSGDDITRSVLLQIITEQESGGEPMFTTGILQHMIRFYGQTTQNAFSSYLEKSLELFSQQQQMMYERMRDMGQGNPLSTMSDLTQRNFEIWKDINNRFMKAAGFPPYQDSDEEDAPASRDDSKTSGTRQNSGSSGGRR